MAGVREGVCHRQLRPVRDPVERDLVESERLSNGLEVLGVLVGAVERPVRADRRGTGCSRGTLLVGRDRRLHRRAVEQTGITCSAVVVGDEGVAGEEEAEEAHRLVVVEPEHVRRALTRAAGDQEDGALRGSERGNDLDVQRDRPRDLPRAVERDDDGRADEARGRAALGRVRGTRADTGRPA